MKTHIIDGEEYEEISRSEWILSDSNSKITLDDKAPIYLRKVKKKIEFPVRVELEDGYCDIVNNGDLIIRYDEFSLECGVLTRKDLQKINEKMKELEEQGAFK